VKSSSGVFNNFARLDDMRYVIFFIQILTDDDDDNV
jgi:hypothetical protein